MEEVIVKAHEIKQKLVEIINDSNLPAVILKPMMEDLCRQLEKEEERQLQQAYAVVEQKKEKNKKKEVKENAEN